MRIDFGKCSLCLPHVRDKASEALSAEHFLHRPTKTRHLFLDSTAYLTALPSPTTNLSHIYFSMVRLNQIFFGWQPRQFPKSFNLTLPFTQSGNLCIQNFLWPVKNNFHISLFNLYADFLLNNLHHFGSSLLFYKTLWQDKWMYTSLIDTILAHPLHCIRPAKTSSYYY